MKDTNIQWCDGTVNPTSGCDGCELWTPGSGGPCYAGSLHQNRLAKSLPLLYAPDFTEVRLIPGRMAKALRCQDLAGRDRPNKPWLNGRRRSYFVGDLGDIFSNAIPFDYLKSEIIDQALTPQGRRHDLLLLTKRPARAVQFAAWLAEQGVSWPANVWLGTSITGPASLGRIAHLGRVPARHRFLSVEPLVEDPRITPETLLSRGDDNQGGPIVDWIIVGGESDQGTLQGREFRLEWARSLRDVARAVGAAYFLKQLGSNPTLRRRPLTLRDGHGGDWGEWPTDLRIRELPPETTTP